MLHCFQSQGNSFQGVVTILLKRLMSLHWKYESNGVWNFHGACFHVFMLSPKHIEFLVERSWLRHVCERVKHRKYLGQMQSLCRMNLNHLSKLSSSQRAMLDFQSCGEQFTNDAKKYFGNVSPSCPFCKNGMDSRLHYFEVCSFFQPVRQEFSHLFAKWDAIPLQAKAYSLWLEPPMYGEFLSLLVFLFLRLENWRTTICSWFSQTVLAVGRSFLTSASALMRLLKYWTTEVAI